MPSEKVKEEFNEMLKRYSQIELSFCAHEH